MADLGRRKYKLNTDTFKTINENTAWLLGLICADGNLHIEYYKGNPRRYNVQVGSVDEYLIKKARNIFRTEKRISTYIHNSRDGCKRKPFFTININSKKIFGDLIGLGLSERKSLNLKFPNTPNLYLKDVIRGYLDGDGSFMQISTGKQKGELRLQFVGSRPFLKTLDKIIKKELDIQSRAGVRPHGSIYKIVFSHYNSIKIGKWLYNSSGPFLNRKRQVLYSLIQPKGVNINER